MLVMNKARSEHHIGLSKEFCQVKNVKKEYIQVGCTASFGETSSDTQNREVDENPEMQNIPEMSMPPWRDIKDYPSNWTRDVQLLVYGF